MRVWHNCLLASMVTASLLTSGQAYADSVGVIGGDVSVPNLLLADDLCVDVPISYDFSMMSSGYSWTLDLDSTSDGGTFAAGDAGDTGLSDAMWCPADLPGDFALTGSLTVRDADYNQVAAEAVSLSFTVRKRSTAASFKVNDSTPKVKSQTIHLKGCVQSSGHRDAYRSMYLQQRRPGKTWHVLGATTTDEAGCFNEDASMDRLGKAYLRAFVPATHSRTGDYSRTITVLSHR